MAETPECIQDNVTIDLIPPNSWLDDEDSSICPVCASAVAWSGRSPKLQHQLWHYIVASRVLPPKSVFTEDVLQDQPSAINLERALMERDERRGGIPRLEALPDLREARSETDGTGGEAGQETSG